MLNSGKALLEVEAKRQLNLPNLTPMPATLLAGNLEPPFFILEDILVKGYEYTLTARNNHGKTTLMALLIKTITEGANLGGLRSVKGRVLLLSGENTSDMMLKLVALEVDMTMVDVVNMPYDLKENIDQQLKQATAEYVGVFVDSNQSYFGDGDMNGNGEMLSHFQSARRLTQLKGNPFVLILAHPIKNATEDNLIPYGGGSAMNEIDTNLTLWKSGDKATLRIGKARQLPFDPINLRLLTYKFDGVFNNFGKQVTTSKFEIMSDDEAESIEHTQMHQDTDLLQALNIKFDTPYQTLGDKYFMKPNESLLDPTAMSSRKKKAERAVKKLMQDGYLTQSRKLTKRGREMMGDKCNY
jgi:hypothetical protein